MAGGNQKDLPADPASGKALIVIGYSLLVFDGYFIVYSDNFWDIKLDIIPFITINK
jgi:hypothetical protein